MAYRKLNEAQRKQVVQLSNRKNADLDAIADQFGITMKDIQNLKGQYRDVNGRKKTKKATTRRYTSADRGRIVELERQLGSAYHRIHVLEQFILEKELGIPSQ